MRSLRSALAVLCLLALVGAVVAQGRFLNLLRRSDRQGAAKPEAVTVKPEAITTKPEAATAKTQAVTAKPAAVKAETSPPQPGKLVVDEAPPVSVRAMLQAPTAAPVPCSPCPEVCSLRQLARMSRDDLLCLYEHAQPGPIPCGFTPGRSMRCCGFGSAPVTCLSRMTVWRGKVFGPECTVHNRLLGINGTRAHVCYGESWHDHRPAIILDYERCSRVAGKLRDEIREVAPCLYVGLTYARRGCEPHLALFFGLDAHNCAPACSGADAAPRSEGGAAETILIDPKKK